MSKPTIRRPALAGSGLIALTLLWVGLRFLFGGEGPPWLFWPFLAFEVFATVRVALLGFRLHIGRDVVPDDALLTDLPPAAEPVAFDIAVLVSDGDPQRARLSLLSAGKVEGARHVWLVGPADDWMEVLAEEFGVRQLVVERGGAAQLEVLAAAAVRATDASLLAFVTSDSVMHHQVVDLSRDAFADPRVAWIQSMPRSAPERDVLHALENDQICVADGANGLARWSINASVVRAEAVRQVLGDPANDDVLSAEGLRSDLLVAEWRGVWSPISLAIANGAERERHDADTADAAARLRLFCSHRSPVWVRGLPVHARLNAISSLFDDFRGLVALGVLGVLVACLLTGELPFSLDLLAMLLAGAVVHSTNSLVRWRLTDRRIGPLATARTAFAAIDPSVAAVLSAPTRRVHGADRSQVRVAFVATSVLLGSLALRAISQVSGWPLSSPGRAQEMVVLTAGMLATVPLLRAIDVIVPVALRRNSARVDGSMRIEMDGDPVEVLDVGPAGVGVRQSDPLPTASPEGCHALEIGATTTVLMDAPGLPSPMRIEGVVRSSLLLSDDSRRVGIEFVDMSSTTRDALMNYWSAAWIPGAADPRCEAGPARASDALKVQVNRRSSPALRVIAAITLVATGVASLPPYGSASAATAPLPKDTLALTKDVRGVGPTGVNTQGTTLYGSETMVELSAYNTWSADDDSRVTYYNVSFRDVVPSGASYVTGSASVEPTAAIADHPGPGQTTLVWQNLSDTQPGSSAKVSYRLSHNGSGAGDQQLAVGDTIGGQAETYANTHPRYVPDFDTSGAAAPGKESYTNSATANGSTTIVPILIYKAESSPEAELLRGAHHPTRYLLTVANNLIAATNQVVVDDYLPAGLEFLGCGTADHTPDDPGAEGGVEYPGAPRLDESSPDLGASDSCAAPVLVETISGDPDAGGPLPDAVYTHVRWVLGDMKPGETRMIAYLAAIPERANTMWPSGAAPDQPVAPAPTAPEVSLAPPSECSAKPDSCAQVANLANNTGELTTETSIEPSLTNLATVAGDYTGRLIDGAESNQVWASVTETVMAEDLAIVKSACNSATNGTNGGSCRNGVQYGDQTDWTLRVRTGEYRGAADVVVVDRLPDGLEYVKGSGVVVDGESSDGLDPSVGSGANGAQTLTWKLPRTLEPTSDVTIRFRSTTLEKYRATGLPVLVFDTLSNRVDLTGITSVVVGEDDLGKLEVRDESSAGLTSNWSSVAKSTLHGDAAAAQSVNGEPCATGFANPVTVAIDGPRFSPGDLVCFELTVDMPQKVRLRDMSLTDFLPPNAEYVGFQPYPDDTEGQYAKPEVVPGFNNAVIWTYGTPIDGAPRYTPVDGGRFHVVLGARVSNDPRANNDFDLYQNLLKVSGVNSQGTSPVSPRASSSYLVAEPVLALTKGVVDVVRAGASIEGYPTAGPVVGDDLHTVAQRDLVTYRVDVANTGVQFRDSGMDPADPGDDIAATTQQAAPSRRSSITTKGKEGDLGLVQPSDAVAVEIWDVLPPAIACDALVSAGSTPVMGAELVLRPGSLPLSIAPVATLSGVSCDPAADRLAATVDRIPAGYDLRIAYKADIGSDLAAGSLHTDTAGVRSYGDVSGAKPYYPIDNIDPAIAPDGKVEPNSPSAIDTASVTLPDAGILKERTTSITETRNDATTQATIGERVQYTVAVKVPSGTSVYQMKVVDPLPGTLRLVEGSTKMTTPAGVDGKGFVLTEDLSANRWSLGFPDSHRNASKAGQTFLITYEAVVLDATANVAGASIVNRATVQWGYSTTTAGDAEKYTASSSTAVVEPKPTLSKAHTPNTNPSTVTGASVVTYTLKVANTKDRSPLHDVVVTDCVPAGLVAVTPTGAFAAYATVEAAGSPCAADATRVVWDLSPLLENTATRPTTAGLQSNETLSLTYTANVTAPAAGDASLVNNAKVTGTSLSGKVAGERTSYAATATDTLKIAKPTIAKTVSSPTLLPGAPTLYSLTVTVPRGIVTHDTTIVDVLPANLVFDSYSSLPTPGSTCDLSGTAPHTITRSGQSIGWFLGDLRTPDGACTITLSYTAHVKSAAAAGNTLTNNVKLLWNLTNRQSDVTAVTGSGFDRNVTSKATVTVVEPKLTIAKAVNDTDRVVEAGQRLTYTLTLTNSGTHPAYDVALSDSFPSGLGATGTLGGTCVGSAAGLIDASERTITWSTLFDGSTGLNVGASCTLTYTQVVDAASAGTVTDGGILKNTVAIKEYWGDPTHAGDDHKKYTGGSAEAQVTTYLPKLSIAKFTGNGTEVADANVGSPFVWRLVISNKGKGTAYGVDVSDTLPINWTFDPGSVQFAASNASNCSPAAAQLTPPVTTTQVSVGDTQRIDWSNLCDLSANSTLTVTFTATPQLAATVTPGLIDADGDKVLQPNVATADGSDAGGTGLQQSADEAAATLRSADVRVVKTDASAVDDGDRDSAGFAVGTVGEYYLDVRNAGPDTASGPIIVTDTVPDGLTARTAVGEGWDCTVVGALVTCTSDGDLAVNKSLARIVVSVDVGLDALNTGDDTGLVTNTAEVTSPSPDPDRENNADSEPTPIARVVDVAITKTLDPATPFVPGTDVTYQIVVTNNGPSPALGTVTVTDDLPGRLRLVAASGAGWDCSDTVMPAGAEDNGNVSCVRTATNVVSGTAFEPIVVTASIDPTLPTSTKVTNVATVDYQGDSDPSNNSSDASSDADARATLSIVKGDGDAAFTAGQTDGRYYVAVANTGPSVEAGPVVVTDTIDEHLQLVAVDATGWSCEVIPGTGFDDGRRGSFSCTWVGTGTTPATAGVDETLSVITVVVAVSPEAISDPRPGAENLVSNEVTVTGTSDTKSHSDDESTPVVPSALLTVDKTHDVARSPWRVGSEQTYRVTVGNDGPSGEYGDVVVEDTLPEGLEFSGASGDGWDCELRTGAGRGPNGTVRCGYARENLSATEVLLAAGDALPPIDIDVVVLPDAAPNAQSDPAVLTNEVANTATVSGVTDTEDRSDTDTVQVQPMADLTIDKSHEADSFQVGETGKFIIRVTNNGPNVASGPVTVVDTVPAGLDFVSGEGLGWTCEPDREAATVTCVHAEPIGVDETSTISLVVDVTPLAYDPVAAEGSEGSDGPAEDAHSVVNTVEVSGPTPETDPDNNSDSDAVDIDPLVDLILTKTHENDFGVTEVGTFLLEVTNAGPAALPKGIVTVVDTLPNGLEFRSANGEGWECTTDQAQVVITCATEASLAIGAPLPAIELAVNVTPAAEGGVVNSAVVSTPIVEVTNDNNTAQDEVTIVPLSNLTVTKALQGQLTLGRQSVWRVVVHNDGPSAAANPVVVDELPDVFTDVAASGDGFACDVVDRTVTCRRTSPLPADASAELVITGLVSSGGGREITNTVRVSTTTPETSIDDNAASAGGVVTEVEADSTGNSTQVGGESQSQTTSLPARLAFTGATILGILAAGAAFLVGGFMFTGFGHRRRRQGT